jgi:hypothetical protein
VEDGTSGDRAKKRPASAFVTLGPSDMNPDFYRACGAFGSGPSI